MLRTISLNGNADVPAANADCAWLSVAGSALAAFSVGSERIIGLPRAA
jgi:hypothetical protein